MADRDAWVEPGAHEVGPGVHRIPLPLPNDGLRAVNTYAISDGDQAVMIDSGWALAESERLLASGLDSIGYGLDTVREYLVTHMHRDHYAQAIVLRRTFGVPVALGVGEAASLAAIRDADRVQPSGIAALVLAGAEDLAKRAAEFELDPEVIAQFADPDRWLDDGIDVTLESRTLRVIATPGHTRGHVVYYDAAANALFAGDHVLPHITPSIGIEPSQAHSPLRDYLDSLRLMLTLPDATLLPAHGPVVGSTHARVEELLAHHEQRLTIMAQAVAGGASTGLEVATVIGWTRRQRRFADLDEFNQRLAVTETMAHLLVLVERGWLSKQDVDGVWRFSAI
jgi:glyoxylase-like metal-dependent hydrolase (beta-lactamase superfamily II)